jgi:long-chain acyl-CoA synthetase
MGAITWAELDGATSDFATGLIGLPATHGERVALIIGNRREFVSAYFAILRAGLIAVPLHAGYMPDEIARRVVESGARLLIADGDTIQSVRAAELADVEVIVAGETFDDERRFNDVLDSGARSRAQSGDSVLPSHGGGEDPALIMYTSGTSGEVRGAVLTHRALRASVEQVASLPSPIVAGDDVTLIVLPLSHIYSLNGTLSAVVRQSSTAVVVSGFDSTDTLRVIREHRVTNIPGAPAIWNVWSRTPGLSEAFRGVRRLFSGSAALSIETQSRVHEQTGMFVHEGYGMTEAAPGVSSTLVSGRIKPGSVGAPFPGVEVRLVDEAGNDVEDDDAEPGEIWIRGDNLFSGYWPDGDGGPDADGWFATGDVAYLDDDGDLHLVDRRKELIIVNGFNVYPREVEQVLMEFDGVVEAAAVGEPNEMSGEQVVAYVVLGEGVNASEAQLQQHCETRLARFKRPVSIASVSELPHSLTGKVVKGRLRNHG